MKLLQELLNLGLVDIGSDDSRFAKMESAALQLSRQFKESPALMITATLVALDEQVPEDDPFFELVEGLVIKEWNTLRNTHVNRPRELLRSIAMSALFEATTEDPERSAVVWNLAAPRLTHDQTSIGKAAGLVSQALEAAFAVSEHEALRRAGMAAVPPRKVRRKQRSSSAPEPSALAADIERDDVLQDVARAAGPLDPEGEAPTDPNRYWSNQAQHWSNEFTPRMSEALVRAVNLGTARLAESVAGELDAHVRAMNEHLRRQMGQVESLQTTLAESAAAGRMRLDVLWWSQARYSHSQKTAYARLPAATAALAAAADLSTLVPVLAPASVTHVLGETLAFCSGSERLSVLEHLKQLMQSPPRGLEGVLAAQNTNVGRVPMAEVVAEVAGGSSVSENDLRTRAGVDPGLMLEPAEFAMWLFRDLQARRIVEATE